MAVNTAVKRRAASGIVFPLGPGVTPNATKNATWRAIAAWGYSEASSAIEWIIRARRRLRR